MENIDAKPMDPTVEVIGVNIDKKPVKIKDKIKFESGYGSELDSCTISMKNAAGEICLVKGAFRGETKKTSDRVLVPDNTSFRNKDKLVFPDGSEYIGYFKDGRMEGPGVLRFSDGSRYRGDFKDGRIEGKGILQWPEGGWQDGNFKGGKMEGSGKLTKDSLEISGNFVQGKLSGKAIAKKLSTSEITYRVYENGKLQSDSPTPPSSEDVKSTITTPNVFLGASADVKLNKKDNINDEKKKGDEKKTNSMPYAVPSPSGTSPKNSLQKLLPPLNSTPSSPLKLLLLLRFLLIHSPAWGQPC